MLVSTSERRRSGQPTSHPARHAGAPSGGRPRRSRSRSPHRAAHGGRDFPRAAVAPQEDAAVGQATPAHPFVKSARRQGTGRQPAAGDRGRSRRERACTPVSAPRIGPARASVSTLFSRGSTSVALSPWSTRMNTGGPNGATPSSRASTPARRTRHDAAAQAWRAGPPRQPSSRSSSARRRQPRWTCVLHRRPRSGNGIPDAVGNVTGRRGAHPVSSSTRQRQEREQQVTCEG